MASTYKSLYGFDWPAGMSDELVGLVIGKKWREYKEHGIEFRDPWDPMLSSMRMLFGQSFKVSKWTEEHVHDWVAEQCVVTLGAASTGKSNDAGACIVCDWVVDPYDTTVLVGSTTKDALRLRTWESIERYFAILKASSRFAVPGKITQTGYAILNDRDDDGDPLAQGAKAGVHGVALNDGGKLQGAHSPYVRLVVDELATINNHEGKGGVVETMLNLQIAKDFKFVALANPGGWTEPSSSIYCTPVDGIDSVNVDTGSWRSTFGAFVRHNDGMKSPCVLDPSLEAEFPFLTRKKHIDTALQRSNGNQDSPSFWRMVRGFPMPTSSGVAPILDPAVASRNHVSDPGPPFNPAMWRGTAAGIDPAWTEGGDGACRARGWLMVDDFGRPYLDFTGGLTYMKISASESARHPAVEQMRNQTVALMRRPYEATFRTTAVDSSGNQGLGADLMIYAGGYDVLQVNSAERASEEAMVAFDLRPAKTMVYDRITEAWVVLARLCEAGMVRGLPPEALRALTTRTSAVNRDAKTGVAVSMKTPQRLEPKAEFRTRFKKSPDEADACALCALAAKERLGLVPFGYLKNPVPSASLVPEDRGSGPSVSAPSEATFSTRPEDAYDMGPAPI